MKWIYSPICDWGTMVLCLSQSGEYSRPSSFSLSPWTKNSSIHRAVQRWWSPQRLAGCDTSQECSIRQRTFVLSKLKFNQIDTKNKTLGMHGSFQTTGISMAKCHRLNNIRILTNFIHQNLFQILIYFIWHFAMGDPVCMYLCV